MPSLETPPNPAPPTPPETPQKIAAGRYGELDHSEVVHLLSSLDDERSRSRFRESVYLSIIIWLAVAWFAVYGPRVLFHQGRIVSPVDVLKQRDKELTYLDLPKTRKPVVPPKNTKALSDQNQVAQTAHPTLDRKTLEQLQAMRRAGEAGRPQPAKPAPLPAAPQPQPAPQQAQPQQQAPQQQAPQQAKVQPPPAPQPRNNPAIPDAPRPSQSTRPNFSTQTDPGQNIRDAANSAAAAAARGQGGENGLGAPLAHQGQQTGAEVLSDTMGVDFGPYIKRLLRMVRASWYPLIPQECYPPLSKEGQTLIRFTIQPNGVVSAMALDGSTHDIAIDKAAWGSIRSIGTFPPLPSSFKGPNLELRLTFIISRTPVAGGDQ